jgi:hypothetical protein
MAMKKSGWMIAPLLVLALAGCGKSGDASGAGDTAGTTAAAPAGGGMPADWKATDACSILNKAAVAAILKVPVPQTQLALVHEPGTADAGTSECTYLGEDGASVASLMTRWSPIADNTPDAIAGAKSTMNATLKGFGKGPVEDVPGLGISAFVAPGLDQLSVYLDESRMIIVSPRKVPDGMSGKDAAVELARKAGA